AKKKSQKRTRRTKVDRQTRRMRVLTGRGFEPTVVRGSRQAKALARYTSAVGHFLRTGDSERLNEFEGLEIAGRSLVTNPEKLVELAQAGELDLHELYVHPDQSR